MQWHTQAGNITTNPKVKVDLILPTLIATNAVMWKCHMDDPAKGRYNIILGRYLLPELGLNLKLSEHVIEAHDQNVKRYTTPMVNLGMYIFKDLNIGEITPEESFTKVYVKEV